MDGDVCVGGERGNEEDEEREARDNQGVSDDGLFHLATHANVTIHA